MAPANCEILCTPGCKKALVVAACTAITLLPSSRSPTVQSGANTNPEEILTPDPQGIPYAGTIELQGQDIRRCRSARAIGLLAQKNSAGVRRYLRFSVPLVISLHQSDC